MKTLRKRKSFEDYFSQVKSEFPQDKILQEIHAIRLKLLKERKAQGLSLEEWSRKMGEKAMRFAKKHDLETTAVL